jgi:hypothetical protein
VERNLASHAAQRRRGGLPRHYVAVWVVLSSIALTYLVTLSVRPDLAEGLGDQVAALAGVEPRSSEAGAAREAHDEQTRADIEALRNALDAVQQEAETLRAKVAASEGQRQDLAARLAAVEAQRTAEQALPIATASVNRGPLDGPAAGHPDALTGHAVEGRVVERPRELELPERKPQPRESERVAFGAPQVKPAAAAPESPRGVQIATGPSVDALRISWMLLSERHKEVLKHYEARFVPVTGGKSPTYRLIAGPIESTSAANRVCGELRARRVTCGVSAFGGEPL